MEITTILLSVLDRLTADIIRPFRLPLFRAVPARSPPAWGSKTGWIGFLLRSFNGVFFRRTRPRRSSDNKRLPSPLWASGRKQNREKIRRNKEQEQTTSLIIVVHVYFPSVSPVFGFRPALNAFTSFRSFSPAFPLRPDDRRWFWRFTCLFLVTEPSWRRTFPFIELNLT